MHAISGSWSGQVFASASSNDTGGKKKTRSRRSKEERKGMVESFIKKYQSTNEGNFPSLNLTHKEVGGSFYTVREIIREIIQENRVLAPPKGSSEEYDHSGYLEQHLLGPLSTEPQSDFSISDGDQITPNESPITREQFSSSNIQFHAPGSELPDKHLLNGVSKVVDGESDPAHDYFRHAKKEEDMDTSQQIYQSKDEIMVNGGKDFEQNPNSNETLITTIAPSNHQGSDSNGLLSGQKLSEQETQMHTYKQKFANDQMFDETKECVQQISSSIVTETLEVEKDGSNTVELVQHVVSDVVVETFPLRPISDALHETASVLEDKASQDDKKHLSSSVGLLTKTEDEKVEELSLETSKVSITSKQTLLDTDDVKDLKKDPIPDGAKVGNYSEQMTSEASNVAGRKFSDKQDSSSPKGGSPPLDRINLGTWQGESKNSARRETNPVLAVVKSFITAFVKFWTE